MAEVTEGTIIDGRYKVVSRLGAGGMADVFLAEDQQLGRKVALKLLHRRFSEDPDFVERFRREAQAAAGLQHPNVVSVYDRGAFDGTYYIAMEYLPGRTLKQLIRQEAPLDPVRAIDITTQILKAARFAHRHGVIHRDLKPHNVIIDDADHAKVTDFGIARAGASDMTETGSIMGTAQYLSPEQAQGHAVSAGSDLYAIGVVLYEMLTGRVPFDAESAVTIALKHVSEAPTAPTAINTQVPVELEQVVLWALNKNPSDRPADADQFLAALDHARAAIVAGSRGQRTVSMPALAGVGAAGALGGEEVGAAAAGAAAGAMVPAMLGDGDGAGALLGEPPESGDPEHRRRWPWLALVVVLLLGGGAAAAYVLTRPVKHVVPSVTGESLNIARTQLQNAGFAVSVIDVTNNRPSGTVIGQDPQGGTKANQGATVGLTVSSGPGSTNVPPVAGLPLKQAEQTITASRLKVGRVIQQTSNQFAAGDVINTDPTAGASLTIGTPVNLFVSSGRPQVNVPDVAGQTESAARATLETAGFKVSSSTQTSSTATAGDVISQSPSGNTQAPFGSTVSIVVAKAPTTATVPNVKGKTAAAATSALKAAGFKVTEVTQTVSLQVNDGKVISQSPASGTTANKNSTVTITVGNYVAPTTTSTTTTTPTTTTTTPKSTTTHT